MLTINEFNKSIEGGITTNHTGKMEGLASLSTNCNCNSYCLSRKDKEGCICSKCFAFKMTSYMENLDEKLTVNYKVLTTRILKKAELPIINYLYFRFEAFGDLQNTIQVVNYFNIARANKNVKCALWTKNPQIIAQAMEEFGIKKPRNLRIIGSSYYLNKPMEEIFRKYDFIDNIFTVYTKDYLKNHEEI